ncbi:MAG: ABC transporter substrate-binding protein [Lentisphaeria bacterium]|nr:ABC transporter substrate-binding protein [Lentisphaeria bacterium]
MIPSGKCFCFSVLCFFAVMLTGAEQIPPQRIVSMAPALTELICHLGRESWLVGRSEACDYPANIRKLPIAGRFGEPQTERTLRLKPTMLTANYLLFPNVGKVFAKAGIRMELMECENLEQYLLCVEKFGAILDRKEAAAQEIKRVRTTLAELEKSHLPVAKRPRVLWIIWDSPLLLAGKGSLPDAVIRYAGGINVAAEVTPPYFQGSMEWVLQNPPDIVVWTSISKVKDASAFLRQLPAIRKGKVIDFIDQDLLQRPGPRLIDGISQLAEAFRKMQEAKP